MTLQHVLVQVQSAVHNMGGSQVSPQAQVGPQSKNPSTILLKIYKDEMGSGPVFVLLLYLTLGLVKITYRPIL